MKKSTEIQTLKKFIDHAKQNRLKLANHLGYSSMTTISHWVRKNKIPPFQKDRTIKFIEEYFNGTAR